MSTRRSRLSPSNRQAYFYLSEREPKTACDCPYPKYLGDDFNCLFHETDG